MKPKCAHDANRLPERVRTELAALLQERLSEGIELMFQAREAHSSVEGPSFVAMHELFEQVYTEVQDQVDLLPERIVELGGTAQCAIEDRPPCFTPPEPHGVPQDRREITVLAQGIAYFGEQIRKSVDLAAKSQDANSVYLLTEISHGVDRSLWFVEAYEGANEEIDQ